MYPGCLGALGCLGVWESGALVFFSVAAPGVDMGTGETSGAGEVFALPTLSAFRIAGSVVVEGPPLT